MTHKACGFQCLFLCVYADIVHTFWKWNRLVREMYEWNWMTSPFPNRNKKWTKKRQKSRIRHVVLTCLVSWTHSEPPYTPSCRGVPVHRLLIKWSWRGSPYNLNTKILIQVCFFLLTSVHHVSWRNTCPSIGLWGACYSQTEPCFILFVFTGNWVVSREQSSHIWGDEDKNCTIIDSRSSQIKTKTQDGFE